MPTLPCWRSPTLNSAADMPDSDGRTDLGLPVTQETLVADDGRSTPGLARAISSRCTAPAPSITSAQRCWISGMVKPGTNTGLVGSSRVSPSTSARTMA